MEGAVTVEHEAQTDEWLRSYIMTTLSQGDVEAFLAGLEESFVADVPELAADADLQHDLRSAIRSQLGAFLAAGTPPSGTDSRAPISPDAHALARTVAQRGLDLRVLSQLYHAGHRAMLGFAGEFLDRENLDPTFKLQVLTTIWSQTGALLNAMLDGLTATYSQERERLLQGTFASRVAAVREILDGGGDVQDAARLGYPLRPVHTAIVLWSEVPVAPAGSLESLAVRISGDRPVLSVPSGARGVWSWIAHRSAVDEVIVDPAIVPDGVRLAVGEPASGIEGFRCSHREAQAARSVAEVGNSDESVTRYRDVELVSMLASDRPAMQALVERELAGLLGEDPGSARLRDTLRAVLGCHGNQESAARRLGIHKNTVRYRMQRVEGILGRDLWSRRLKLELALECLAVFGA